MKNNRKEITILSLVIVFVLTILVSSSYAWFVVTDESKKDVTIKVGDLNLTYTDNNSNVELLNKAPISIEDAFNEDGYNFTLTNTGSIKSKYTVVLDDKTLNNGETRLDNKYVRYILKSGNATKIGLLSELSDNKLVEGVLIKNGTVTFNLKLFLDEDAFDKDAASKVLKKEIKVTADQYNGDVNVNQILTTMTITVLSGAKSTSSDIIKLGDEEFYNIGEENEYTKLLAKNLLGSENKQVEKDYVTMNFAKTNYWINWGEEYTALSYDNYKYIYAEDSNLYPYVENYVIELSKLGLNNISGKLLTAEEAEDLSKDKKLSKDYWTGSNRGVNSLIACSTVCNNYSYKCYGDSPWDVGIRPVILIPSYYLK